MVGWKHATLFLFLRLMWLELDVDLTANVTFHGLWFENPLDQSYAVPAV